MFFMNFFFNLVFLDCFSEASFMPLLFHNRDPSMAVESGVLAHWFCGATLMLGTFAAHRAIAIFLQ